MIFNPLVSIIIPVFNGSNFLSEAIDSALAQTYQNIEIIVVNDGSTDNGKTEQIILSYGDKIKYIKKKNGGVSSALNVGISEMKGEYFSWLSHDDKYTPQKIENQVKMLAQYPERPLIAYCACVQIDKDSNIITWRNLDLPLQESKLNAWRDVLLIQLRKGTLNGCALLIHKSIFENCGYFDERLRFNQDAFMWYKIFIKGYGLLYSKYVGVQSRVHEQQLTQTGQELFHHDSLKMSTFLIPKFLEISTRQENFLYYYSLYNAKYNNREVVSQCINLGKQNTALTDRQILSIHLFLYYGRLRPLLRLLYHKFFNKMQLK